jgi:GntR family transcriptional regulator
VDNVLVRVAHWLAANESAGTVARVYRELEAIGVLRTARRNGTVVAAVPLSAVDTASALAAAAGEFAVRAKALGVGAEAAAEAVLAAYAESGPRESIG